MNPLTLFPLFWEILFVLLFLKKGAGPLILLNLLFYERPAGSPPFNITIFYILLHSSFLIKKEFYLQLNMIHAQHLLFLVSHHAFLSE